MSFSYERYERQQRRVGGSSNRSPLGYWVPLIVTVAIATGGIAAWVWNERGKGSEEDDYEEYDYYEDHVEDERDTVSGTQGSRGPPSVTGTSSYGETVRSYSETQEQSSQNESFVSQMRGAIRRTPSPQKMLEGASKRVSAGMAAIGRGLGSITEDKGEDFVDHERWSEEAESREQSEEEHAAGSGTVGGTALTAATAAAAGLGAFGSSTSREVSTLGNGRNGPRRTVAVVVSAESDKSTTEGAEDASYHIEHTSVLSHLVGHVASTNVQLLILIYAPHLQSHPLSYTQTKPSRRQSSTDSFAEVTAEDNEIDPDAAEGRIISSYTSDEAPALYNALATQAATLVSHPTQIMPFTSLDSHIHMLRHLGPNLVYMQESLCGEHGEAVEQVSGWIGQCVVVVGAEGAGLVDTETEDESHGDKKRRSSKWWQDEKRVGLGKGVEIVDSTRLGEDWAKRVEAK